MTKVIELKNVNKIYKGGLFKKDVHALKNLNLTVNKGEAYGFIGPNGAGKSTTIKILTGLSFVSSGDVIINGLSYRNSKARKKLGFLPESPYIYDYLSGWEFLKFSASFSNDLIENSEARIKECIELVGLYDARKLRIHKYSRGMVQRLGIAHAMLANPEILILDEPLSGLDPLGRRDVRNILNKLRNQGKTIFFSSHIINDVEKIASRIAVIRKGSIVAEDSIDQITKNHDLEEFFVYETN